MKKKKADCKVSQSSLALLSLGVRTVQAPRCIIEKKGSNADSSATSEGNHGNRREVKMKWGSKHQR